MSRFSQSGCKESPADEGTSTQARWKAKKTVGSLWTSVLQCSGPAVVLAACGIMNGRSLGRCKRADTARPRGPIALCADRETVHTNACARTGSTGWTFGRKCSLAQLKVKSTKLCSPVILPTLARYHEVTPISKPTTQHHGRAEIDLARSGNGLSRGTPTKLILRALIIRLRAV